MVAACRIMARPRILLPAGHRGVALMIFDNSTSSNATNPADAYVIAVGHLSDRITGGDPFRGSWPREDRTLSRDEREELQRRLVAAGFHRYNVDGIIGPQTIDSVRRFQASSARCPTATPRSACWNSSAEPGPGGLPARAKDPKKR